MEVELRMGGGRTEIHKCDTPFAFGTYVGPSADLITTAADRDFSEGQSNWTVVSGGDVTWDNTDMDVGDDEWNLVSLVVTLTEGAVYRLSFDVTAYTSGSMVGYVGGTDEANYQVITPTTTGSFVIDLLAGASDYILLGFTGIMSIDNVSVKHASATLKKKGADFLSCGCEIGMPIYNTTMDTNGLITAVTEDTITDDTNLWSNGDEYEIYLQTKDTFISSQIVDRSRGWRTDPKDMIEGWRKEDLDIDRKNPGKVFGAGQPE